MFRERHIATERIPKAAHILLLLGCEVAQIGLNLLYISNIFKEFLCVDHILVHHIKVGNKHLAPMVEVVKVLLVKLVIDRMQLRYKTQTIGRMERRDLRHQLVNRNKLR